MVFQNQNGIVRRNGGSDDDSRRDWPITRESRAIIHGIIRRRVRNRAGISFSRKLASARIGQRKHISNLACVPEAVPNALSFREESLVPIGIADSAHGLPGAKIWKRKANDAFLFEEGAFTFFWGKPSPEPIGHQLFRAEWPQEGVGGNGSAQPHWQVDWPLADFEHVVSGIHFGMAGWECQMTANGVEEANHFSALEEVYDMRTPRRPLKNGPSVLLNTLWIRSSISIRKNRPQAAKAGNCRFSAFRLAGFAFRFSTTSGPPISFSNEARAFCVKSWRGFRDVLGIGAL